MLGALLDAVQRIKDDNLRVGIGKEQAGASLTWLLGHAVPVDEHLPPRAVVDLGIGKLAQQHGSLHAGGRWGERTHGPGDQGFFLTYERKPTPRIALANMRSITFPVDHFLELPHFRHDRIGRARRPISVTGIRRQGFLRGRGVSGCDRLTFVLHPRMVASTRELIDAGLHGQGELHHANAQLPIIGAQQVGGCLHGGGARPAVRGQCGIHAFPGGSAPLVSGGAALAGIRFQGCQQRSNISGLHGTQPAGGFLVT